ncbi:glutamate--tRNA ligase [Clostridium thermosuccinogenes]|uniref:Glutamate--tRNA ligase n=1 Tax=Clostridium thermosuccinogenes TaxID=84032 RepID=A0A2K2FKL4_9CLOT|nr:glutamate--tRNA ligase [Pseudoclostridium thermosuccinogenes]AUS97676.1 glutamate--tRNA ligase [Pseudoclostridium thermosuccinogenes]PNT97390.1 glutamate--tRNA ligase [Pseudoclostridium thermosuccinogenes]PNT99326.1 glutamate--tRNA ligase [Pseudoclostridium thermosuccinogenes]
MAVEVRTRYAPSPTGYMHIGNLRTALYEYLIAKSNNGKFILRIEDTDQERYVEGAVDLIYRTLKLVGLKHDEGPDIGGEYGPYVQSQRKDTYMPYAKKLVEQGDAYYCFCTKERLAKLREEQEAAGMTCRYDRHCLSLSKEEVERKLAAGEPFVIRQKMPQSGVTTFEDAVYGTITVDNSELEDQILIKSDGLPTYNFANVIDDHLMRITHVVRGSEYLSSTPKYNLLYKAFGWEIPTYVHLPLITKTDGAKISKRAGDASFEDLMEMGYLPEAIVNYVALLGWSPGTNQEIFSLQELEKVFNIDGISKSPAAFDFAKLNWFNGEYIRKLSLEEFNNLAKPYYEKAIANKNIDFMKISKLLQVRTEVLKTIPETVDFIDALPDYDKELYVHKKSKTNLENSLESLKAAVPVLEAIEDWNEQTIHDELLKLVEKMGIKNSQMLWPIRIAISGKLVTPGGAIEIADILGKEETIRRIKIGIEKLSA